MHYTQQPTIPNRIEAVKNQSPKEELPVNEQRPADTSAMVTDTRDSINPPFLPLQRGYELPSARRPQLLFGVSEPSETHPQLTVAEYHPRQDFNSSNFDEPSTSRQVPPNTGGVMLRRQWEQYSFAGPGGSVSQGYGQMHMGFHGYQQTTGSQHFGLGLGTAPRAILDAENARGQAPPPEIQDPKLELKRTKIRGSWNKVDDERVTYCVNIYCDNQLINNTPMKTPKTEIEYSRLKPSCEYMCEVWTCSSCGLESGKTWSNAVNTPDTQECTPSEDEGGKGGMMSLAHCQGASLTFKGSNFYFGGQQQPPEEKGTQGSSKSSTKQHKEEEEQEHQIPDSPEQQRAEEGREVEDSVSDRETGDGSIE